MTGEDVLIYEITRVFCVRYDSSVSCVVVISNGVFYEL